MSESIRDLASWYPLIPEPGSVPDIAKIILDMRVCISLSTWDLHVHGPDAWIESQGTARLTAVAPGALTVQVTVGHMKDRGDAPLVYTVHVPVYVGRDVVPPAIGSYAICSEAPAASTLASSYEIHPNCLLFSSSATDIDFMVRGDVESTDGTIDDNTGKRIDGATGDPVSARLPVLSFEDGYNVKVSGADSTLVFTGAVGAGKGVWTVSPFSDIPDFSVKPGRGLRSINGQTGAVILEGSPSVNVTVYEELDDVTGQQTLVVELQPSGVTD